MKTAYLDCFSGISGDMFIAALLDAGLPFEELKNTLGTLPFSHYHLEIRREARKSISGTRFEVKSEEQKQVARNLETIREIILQGELSVTVKEKCIKVFNDLARVEGAIHNTPPEKIHFHEVGAVDSIIDIVGTMFGIEYLGIKTIFASQLPLGSGFIETAHGRIPIPAPATIALLRGMPVFDSGIQQELITPTGAVLIKNLVSSFGPMPPMVVGTIGYGAGKRDLADRPNLLRILIGDLQSDEATETVAVLEANLDDANPEWLGYVMETLFEAGALDVVFCPVQMKKNRPGVQIQVVAQPDKRDALMEILFTESTTLGVRFQFTQRKVLVRSSEELDSPWGKIRVKRVLIPGGTPYYLPEYEACREISQKNNRPLREIFYWVMGLNNK
jgi:uncharacterized protein (TIGR00299 family) protein